MRDKFNQGGQLHKHFMKMRKLFKKIKYVFYNRASCIGQPEKLYENIKIIEIIFLILLRVGYPVLNNIHFAP